MPNVLELFNQRELLDYSREREYPAMLGEELFPEVKRESLEFDMLISGSRTPVIASVHGFDTETEIGQREAQKKAIELALIKRKMQLKEKEIIALENPRTDAEKNYLMRNVFADFDALAQSVRARVELMRMEVLAKGKLTLNENGLDATIDFGVPAEHKAAGVNWDSADSDPIEDIMTWYNKMGVKPKRALTSNTVLSKLLKHPKVIQRLFGANATRIATTAELNNYLVSLQLPQITTYDEVYKKVAADGKYETKRYFPEESFAMFPAGTLGETVYGPTAEEVRLLRDPAIDSEKIGKILIMMYEEGKDPVATWEKAVATALPTFPYSDEIFQAEITL
ncbi:MAG: major capsid protein [Clostridia bacterium]|nr:major capsid protein [Clostridia bacterium]